MSKHSENEILLLRDPSTVVTDELLKELLGIRYPAYCELVTFLETIDIDLSWQFYKDGTAWLAKGPYTWTGPRGGKREYNTFWLSVWDGFFEVSVYFKDTERGEVLALPLEESTLDLIRSAQKMGKINTFPVTMRIHNQELPNDLLTLIKYKKSLAK
jgi:hypothetical protein